MQTLDTCSDVQLFDEIPLMLFAYAALYCALEILHKEPRKHVAPIVATACSFNVFAYVYLEWYVLDIARLRGKYF